jgi:hypothetical protein
VKKDAASLASYTEKSRAFLYLENPALDEPNHGERDVMQELLGVLPALGLIAAQLVHVSVTRSTEMRTHRVVYLDSKSASVGESPHTCVVGKHYRSVTCPTAHAALTIRSIAKYLKLTPNVHRAELAAHTGTACQPP